MRWIFRSPKQLFCAFGAVCFLLSAQTNPKADNTPAVPTIKTSVRQVLVPIVVANKKGHPVSNLPESDFMVWEDEVPQRIVAFRRTYDASLEKSHSPVAGDTAADSTAGSPVRFGSESPTRTYLVCVDTLHSNLGNVDQTRRALTKFFQGERDAKA